jgi:hypothetical protein
MRSVIILMLILLVLSFGIFCQENRKDTRRQILKEDGHNCYKSDQITKLDLLEALEFAGIQIHKFKIGRFDKKYYLKLMVDEYVNGKKVKSDILYSEDNLYHYYLSGKKEYFLDYIDQIKIITKDEENKSLLFIKTYKMSTRKEITYQKRDEKQFYLWRRYLDTEWKVNQEIPLMVYASSWLDKKIGLHRFCGSVHLTKNHEKTNELLSKSPHYFLFYYQVSETENM